MGVPGVRGQCAKPVATGLSRSDLAGAPERDAGEAASRGELGVVFVVCLFDLPMIG